MKSLLRCKSVCKNWYDLIKTPYFIAKHLQTQSAPNSTSLLVASTNYETQKHDMSLIYSDGSNSFSTINLDFPFLNQGWENTGKKHILVVGICNGLVCISFSPGGFPLFLCNPTTRQFREIPNSECQWVDKMYYCSYFAKIEWVSFGFGFHPGANDYKLIRIVRYFSPIEKANIRAHLYVMSSDTWREIDVNKLSVFFGERNNSGGFASLVEINGSSAAVVLNGVFYWLASVYPPLEVIVMSFDMGDEVFRKIGLPPCLIEEREVSFKIMELEDKLGVVISPVDKLCEVWVLNEDQSSWTKQLKVGSFPRFPIYRGLHGNHKITLLRVVKNGEFVATDQTESGDLKLVSYDPDTGKTTDFYCGQIPFHSHIYLYVETLLPVMQTLALNLLN